MRLRHEKRAVSSLRILISGASGFVGAPLFSHFAEQGHSVFSLVRSAKAGIDEIVWNPDSGKAVKESFEGFDAVIHLAGEPLTLKRWSKEKKEKILHSRTVGTAFLSSLLSTLRHPPKVFISASAIGYFGDRGEELLDEKSSAGNLFLSKVCVEWEKASLPIENRGVRTVQTRFGMVIGPDGGALQKLLLPYKLGFGATLGSGEQWMSWISLHDLIHAMDHLLCTDLSGPVNFVSPHPIRQHDFSSTLASLLNRPSLMKIPAFALRLALGDTADQLLLASTRAVPKKLRDSGFTFKYPTLEEALRKSLKN
jgi:uncharacterized protein (TIGR01777 family)